MRYFKPDALAARILPAWLMWLALCPPAAQAAIYKWTNADGEVVYSQIPPPQGREAADRLRPPPPPAETPEAAQKRLKALEQRLDKQRKARQQAGKKDEKAAERARIRQHNCEAARSNLSGLETKTHPLVPDGHGGMRRMTAPEREQKLEQLRADVDKYCG